MIQVEEWLPIEGFQIYEVSNLGRVRNLKSNEIRRTQKNHQGFPTLVLYKSPDPSRYIRQLNSLVAKAFLPPPESSTLSAIWHNDGDLENCQADNLQWDMRSRVLEWNEMHRTPQPKYPTGNVMHNPTGRIYLNAFECGLAVGETETAVVMHIERMAAYEDRAKFKYV